MGLFIQIIEKQGTIPWDDLSLNGRTKKGLHRHGRQGEAEGQEGSRGCQRGTGGDDGAEMADDGGTTPKAAPKAAPKVSLSIPTHIHELTDPI